MSKISLIVYFCAISLCLLSYTTALRPTYRDYPGPYCAARRGDRCCTERQDGCAVPISTTLCYCDEFCDRGLSGDCCPDYEPVCLGLEPEPLKQCIHNGRGFTPFDAPIKDNCNTCKCNNDGSVDCTQDLCLVDDHLLRHISHLQSSLGWYARNYSEFYGHKHSEGILLRLGTFEPIVKVKHMSRLSIKLEEIQKHFDSFTYWPGLISDVKDQGWCGSSWAVSTSSVASDRFKIISKGKENVDLAPQQFISCVRKQQGCQGGHLDTAWNYFRKVGLVDEACYPYTKSRTSCKIRRSDNLVSAKCTLPTKVDRTSFYKMGPAFSLNNETDIMLEIFKHGPVQATMRVYRDFFSYSGGIYRRSASTGSERSGFHSVRLVGWGEERVDYKITKYWIAVNSWGEWWGENGRFRILRGSNECEIENYVLASLPHLQEKVKFSRKNYRG